MNAPHLQRGLLLQEQDRHELAEEAFRQHLVSDPTDGFAHAVLAISLAKLKRRDAAEECARQAIAHGPDLPFAHYAMARVLTDRNRFDDAHQAIQEAIRLEPTNADFHALLSAIEFERERWHEALAAADAGLQFDPEHVGCNNLRAMALVKLGRKREAGATIETTLARRPDDSFAHANQGWTLLESGRRREAMEHFRESLRLDPTNDWARAGLVEALKAGNPIYAVMLKYFLWMNKLSSRARWGIILGGYFGSRLLAGAAAASPGLTVWVMPIRVLYVAFALLTWLAHPLFNLMLFLHPIGRHALDDDQRAQARWVGLTLAVSLVSLVAWLIMPHTGWHIPAIVFGLLALPISGIHVCVSGWPRRTMAGITFLLLAVGLAAVASHALLAPAPGSELESLGYGALGMFLVGIFASQWLANWLITRRPAQ